MVLLVIGVLPGHNGRIGHHDHTHFIGQTPAVIHLPIHASWPNQIELFFSIVQRKALTPNEFGSLDDLPARLLTFGELSRPWPRPFRWTFTCAALAALLTRLARREPQLRLAA